MAQRFVTFPSGALSLEGCLHTPPGQGPFAAVVVCHPHPLYGGSMEERVVHSLCMELERHGMLAFRFNYRGVGNSQGDYGRVTGEMEDVQAAVDFIQSLPEVDKEKMALAGYSFGALVGPAAVVDDSRIRAVAAISPPLPMYDFSFFRRCAKPQFLICGDEDEMIPLETFQGFAASLSPPVQWEIVRGARHYWLGCEDQAVRKVVRFLEQVLLGERSP